MTRLLLLLYQPLVSNKIDLNWVFLDLYIPAMATKIMQSLKRNGRFIFVANLCWFYFNNNCYLSLSAAAKQKWNFSFCFSFQCLFFNFSSFLIISIITALHVELVVFWNLFFCFADDFSSKLLAEERFDFNKIHCQGLGLFCIFFSSIFQFLFKVQFAYFLTPFHTH